MEDYKLRDLRASHTLGWSWNSNIGFSFSPFSFFSLEIGAFLFIPGIRWRKCNVRARTVDDGTVVDDVGS